MMYILYLVSSGLLLKNLSAPVEGNRIPNTTNKNTGSVLRRAEIEQLFWFSLQVGRTHVERRAKFDGESATRKK
jgi:hypothetical protein